MSQQNEKVLDTLYATARDRTRYPREAYEFLLEAIDYGIRGIGTRKNMPKESVPHCFREFAVLEYGSLAPETVGRIFGCLPRLGDIEYMLGLLVREKMLIYNEEDHKTSLGDPGEPVFGLEFESLVREGIEAAARDLDPLDVRMTELDKIIQQKKGGPHWSY